MTAQARETLGAGELPPHNGSETVAIMIDPSYDASAGPRAGTHMLVAGGRAAIEYVNEEMAPGARVAALVSYWSKDHLRAALAPFGMDPDKPLGGAEGGPTAVIAAHGNHAIIAETLQTLTSAKEARVLYAKGVPRPWSEKLYEGDVMSVGKGSAPAIARETGMGEEEVLRSRWIVTRSGDALVDETGRHRTSQISEEAVKEDLKAVSAARAQAGDELGYRRAMATRVVAHGHRTAPPYPRRWDVVAIGEAAAAAVEIPKGDILGSAGEGKVPNALRLQALPWIVAEAHGKEAVIQTISGRTPLTARVRADDVMQLDEDDRRAMAEIARRGGDKEVADVLARIDKMREAESGLGPRAAEREAAPSTKAVIKEGLTRESGRMTIYVTRAEVSDALGVLEGRPNATAAGLAIAHLSDAALHDQWAKQPDGRMVKTDEVRTGKDALFSLEREFGAVKFRKLNLDEMKVMTGRHRHDAGAKEAIMAMLDQSDSRAAEVKQRTAAPAPRIAGASNGR